jgi:hypothetical protein
MTKRGPRCTVCQHPERWRIELLHAGGASLDALGKKFGLSKDAIGRHWRTHVHEDMKRTYLVGPAQLADLAQLAAKEGASVLDHFRAVRTMLMAQLAATTEAGDARGASIVSGPLITALEKIGKITGEVAAIASSTINITNNTATVNSPAFAKVQAAMLRALAAFPEARAAVVAELRALDAEGPTGGPMTIEHMPAPTPLPY